MCVCVCVCVCVCLCVCVCVFCQAGGRRRLVALEQQELQREEDGEVGQGVSGGWRRRRGLLEGGGGGGGGAGAEGADNAPPAAAGGDHTSGTGGGAASPGANSTDSGSGTDAGRDTGTGGDAGTGTGTGGTGGADSSTDTGGADTGGGGSELPPPPSDADFVSGLGSEYVLGRVNISVLLSFDTTCVVLHGVGMKVDSAQFHYMGGVWRGGCGGVGGCAYLRVGERAWAGGVGSGTGGSGGLRPPLQRRARAVRRRAPGVWAFRRRGDAPHVPFEHPRPALQAP